MVFITRQDLAAGEVDAISNKIISKVQKQGGNLVYREYWGLRNLAYKIEKNSKGHYVMIGLETTPQVLEEVEKIMRFEAGIVRRNIFRSDKLNTEPSEMFLSETAKEGKNKRSQFGVANSVEATDTAKLDRSLDSITKDVGEASAEESNKVIKED